MGARRAGWFSGLRRGVVRGLTDWLDVVGLLLVVAGVWVALGLWAALLGAGAGVLLVSRGLALRAQRRRARAGGEVA